MRRILAVSIWVLGAALACANDDAVAPGAQRYRQTGPAQLVFDLRPDSVQPPFTGTVEAIDNDGQVRLAPPKYPTKSAAARGAGVSEGLYLGLVAGSLDSLDHPRLLRVQVTEVTRSGRVVGKVGPNLADKVKPGEVILLDRPQKATTEGLRKFPDILPVESDVPLAQHESERTKRTANNLARLGVAFSDYFNAFKQFPPARLVGPDGKPWHSWRVLLLPFLGEEIRYRQYRFDEPWDGANNKKLLEPMPAVYSDEPLGSSAGQFTRFAAVTGTGLMFTVEGNRIKGTKGTLNRGPGTKMRDIVDGASTTLAIGTLPADVKIPWMKPEDVVVADVPAANSALQGFGATYQSQSGRMAIFLRADGSVTGVLDTIEPGLFRSMLTIAGREMPGREKLAVFLVPQVLEANSGPVVELLRDSGKLKARLNR